MAEPLTKVKLLEKASAKPLVKEDIWDYEGGLYKEKKFVSVTSLKSALEYFEVELAKSFNVSYEYNLSLSKASVIMKKAFPAIYDNEKGDKK